MSSHTNDELRERILAELKHAYYNAATDDVALSNGVIPNKKHALGILENKANDLMQLIHQHTEQAVREATEAIYRTKMKYRPGAEIGDYVILDRLPRKNPTYHSAKLLVRCKLCKNTLLKVGDKRTLYQAHRGCKTVAQLITNHKAGDDE